MRLYALIGGIEHWAIPLFSRTPLRWPYTRQHLAAQQCCTQHFAWCMARPLSCMFRATRSTRFLGLERGSIRSNMLRAKLHA